MKHAITALAVAAALFAAPAQAHTPTNTAAQAKVVTAAIQPPARPGETRFIHVGPRSLAITWQPAPATRTAPVHHYQVRFNGTSYSTTETSFRMPPPSESGRFSVRAWNHAGHSDWRHSRRVFVDPQP